MAITQSRVYTESLFVAFAAWAIVAPLGLVGWWGYVAARTGSLTGWQDVELRGRGVHFGGGREALGYVGRILGGRIHYYLTAELADPDVRWLVPRCQEGHSNALRHARLQTDRVAEPYMVHAPRQMAGEMMLGHWLMARWEHLGVQRADRRDLQTLADRAVERGSSRADVRADHGLDLADPVRLVGRARCRREAARTHRTTVTP
ncbi:hypothetical protein [Amycolatopsis decaplanina]|uniref:hypothetical protein n=1 Tax=Amycolatopsis decaplanina TaxID=208441 RepID=UPI00126973F5|nr:hypothetical protein [Amycolatopsis decaplanina]